MNRYFILVYICFLTFSGKAQDLVGVANKFLNSLDSNQKALVLYPFDTDERYNFHFIPKEDRKGIMLKQLTVVQQQAAFNLLRNSLSDNTVKKVQGIRELEPILKELEHRK